MDETLKKQLEITACKVRMGIIEGVFNAKSGHPGGCASASLNFAPSLFFPPLAAAIRYN